MGKGREWAAYAVILTSAQAAILRIVRDHKSVDDVIAEASKAAVKHDVVAKSRAAMARWLTTGSCARACRAIGAPYIPYVAGGWDFAVAQAAVAVEHIEVISGAADLGAFISFIQETKHVIQAAHSEALDYQQSVRLIELLLQLALERRTLKLQSSLGVHTVADVLGMLRRGCEDWEDCAARSVERAVTYHVIDFANAVDAKLVGQDWAAVSILVIGGEALANSLAS